MCFCATPRLWTIPFVSGILTLQNGDAKNVWRVQDYKAKRFEEAIAHYNRAWELYDEDISFITNRCVSLVPSNHAMSNLSPSDDNVTSSHLFQSANAFPNSLAS